MRFANPYFLIAFAAAALPILIHLLTRDRIRKVAFSSLRFFAKTSAKVLRRKKFQEAVLLAMRVLILAMLAAAFARPFIPDKASAEVPAISARAARVIVVDVSGSMTRPGCMDMARQLAEKALKELSEGRDAAGLIAFADTPTAESELSAQFGGIISRIRSMRAGFGATNIADALRAADEMLRRNQAGTKDIVLISDLQKSGWQGALAKKGEWKLASDMKLTIRPVSAGDSTGGITITETDCPESLVMDNNPRTIAVRLANAARQDVADVPVTLTVAGKIVATRKINIRAGTTVAARFDYVFTTPGDNPGSVEIGTGNLAGAGPDAIGDFRNFGRIFYFNARVIPRIQVVIINGAPSSNPAMDGAFFLAKALAPVQDSSFAVRAVPAVSATADDLKDALVVIVSNVGELPSKTVSAMSGLLARGGGVLFLPGDRTTAGDFEKTFGSIAPCKLRQTLVAETVAGEVGGNTFGKIDYEHPIFEIFLRPHYGDFSTARFFRRWEVGDSQLSRVVARFDDGKPAILERQVGRGISMLLASSSDLRWTNLPLRAIFLPYLHQTVRYLAIRSERKTACQVGARLAIPEGYQLKDPSGQVHLNSPGAADGEIEISASSPGFYVLNGPAQAVAASDGAETFCYAVNTAPSEADQATVSAEEIAAAIQRSPGDITEAAAAREAIKEQDKSRWGIWWFITAALAGLFVLELFVANKTLRH